MPGGSWRRWGAYVLFRLFYPHVEGPVSRRRRADASLARDAGYPGPGAGGNPRGAIKAVHCWPNRDALGHAGAGWTVNIETTGKPPARSLTEGEGLDQSARQLRALVVALGYGGQWAGSPDVPLKPPEKERATWIFCKPFQYERGAGGIAARYLANKLGILGGRRTGSSPS